MLDPIAAFMRLHVETEADFIDLPDKMQIIGANLIPGRDPEYVIAATHIGAIQVGETQVRVLKCFAINIADYQKMREQIPQSEFEKIQSDSNGAVMANQELIRQDGWIAWHGGSDECPVPAGTFIEVAYARITGIHSGKAEAFTTWRWTGHNDDIVGYRIIKE